MLLVVRRPQFEILNVSRLPSHAEITRFATWYGDIDRAIMAAERVKRSMQAIEDWLSQLGLGKYAEAFVRNSLGAQELKGFKSPVAVFAVRGEREVESRFDARHASTLSKFVGRTNEIGMLFDRWLVKGGKDQAVFLSGEAGIGKSRLVDALEERLHGQQHELIRLQCSPYHATSAFYPIIERL